jgi:ribosomal protein L37E
MLFLMVLILMGASWRGLVIYLALNLSYSVVIGVAMVRFNRRLVRRVRAADHLLCWTCGYDLSHAREAGRCPECGRPFEAESLQARWGKVTWMSQAHPKGAASRNLPRSAAGSR